MIAVGMTNRYLGDNSTSPFVTRTDSLNPLSTIYRRLTSCIVGCRKSNLHSAGEAEAAFDSGTATVEPVGHAAADRAPRGRQAATVLAPGRQSAAEGVVVRGLQIANEFPGSVIWAARDGGECGASYCCFNLYFPLGSPLGIGRVRNLVKLLFHVHAETPAPYLRV